MERLGEFLFAGLERRFGALLLGNVAQGGDAAGLVVDLDQAAGNHAGQRLPVLVVDHHGDVVQGLVADHPFNASGAFGRFGPQADLFGGVAQHLLGVPAKYLGKGRVDLDELAAVLAGHADRVGAGLEQAGELFFRAGQALFAFDLVGDVQQGAGHAQRVALFVAVQPGAAFDVARAAVFHLDAIGDLVIAGRAFAQAAIGLAHGAALHFRHAFEKRLEGFVKGHRLKAMQFGRTCRAIEHAAGDVPVPGTQLRRVQGQVQAFLAVLERLFCAFVFAGVDEGAEQIGGTFQFDVLGAEDAVVNFAAAAAKLHFEGHRAAGAAGRRQHLVALLRMDPQAQLQGALVDDLVAWPAEDLLEVLVDLVDPAVGAAGQQDHIGAQVEEGGKALFRVDQRCFPISLAGDLADHPDHLPPAVAVRGHAAVDFQPVQAAVGPADAMAQSLFHRLAIDHRMKRLQGAGAVFHGHQFEVVQVVGQWLVRVEAE
uniref:Uncharacterized protein n=1 Tax=Pseudomonas fluorescens TaxID=294 RepID=A0A5E6XCD0_PSEFL|nr:hypothetical protein PS652_05267 [Pseudomonas fluorescens]